MIIKSPWLLTIQSLSLIVAVLTAVALAFSVLMPTSESLSPDILTPVSQLDSEPNVSSLADVEPTDAKFDELVEVYEATILKSRSILACRDKLRQMTEFETFICLECIAYESSRKGAKVTIDGKLQNAYGAWRPVVLECVYSKDETKEPRYRVL